MVETYLDAIARHDWPVLRALLAEDVVRVGPFGDTVRGREEYVRFLTELMPNLRGYAMDVTRVTYGDDGRRAFAELVETVTVDDAPTATPEVLVVEVDEGGRIHRVEIYIRRE